MSLASGTRLGTYEITAPLGVGGMGEVYRARDTRLDRDVAIKVLPADFADSNERVARFEREAKSLAALNHPNVATLYGFEQHDGTHFLVMELVEGEDLADRISRGPIPVNEAIPLFVQIAEGLEAAHEKGIVHRDLKPANIKIGKDGRVKILDFGLAKAMDSAPGSDLDLSQSPTMTAAATIRGEIMGTAAYMSPEQAEGRDVDERTDMWAFGVCLLEALTARRAFEGDSAARIIASVLTEDPPWEALPHDTPPAVRRLLRRSLEKSPTDRLPHLGAARLELVEADETPGEEVVSSRHDRQLWNWKLVATGLTVALLVSLALLISRFGWNEPVSPQSTSGPIRFSLSLPKEAPMSTIGWPGLVLAVSPDGRNLTYVARADGQKFLQVRNLDDLGFTRLDGSENAAQPFFSPDGNWIAFFTASGELRKVSIEGGQAIVLARNIDFASWGFGSWGDDDQIVFTNDVPVLSRIPADGGRVETLLTVPGRRLGNPEVLPGSTHALVDHEDGQGVRIAVVSLADPDADLVTLLEDASRPRALVSGHLLFVRNGVPMVSKFDLERLRLSGSPSPLPVSIRSDRYDSKLPVPQMAVSDTGTLVYAEAPNPQHLTTDLLWIEVDGSRDVIASFPGGPPLLDLSPTGTALALASQDGDGALVRHFELERKVPTNLQRLPKSEVIGPLWTPDGSAVTVTVVDGRDQARFLTVPVDGTGELTELERRGTNWVAAGSYDADGRLFAYALDDGLWVHDSSLDGTDRDQHFRPRRADDSLIHGPSLSPSGEWIAYVSYEVDGKPEVFVDRFPGGSRGQRLSKRGGGSPRWSHDGRSLYFLTSLDETGARLFREIEVVPVAEINGQLEIGEGRRIYIPPLHITDTGHYYDVAQDGRIVIVESDERLWSTSRLIVVANWYDEVDQLLTTD